MSELPTHNLRISDLMPGFRLDQQNEIKVWDLGFATAEAAGYLRSRTKKNDAKPLAATAFVAGFMGGAFLGRLPNWIESAFEPEVYGWIREGYSASSSLEGRYVGMPYEANLGDEYHRGGLTLVLAITDDATTTSEEEVVQMVIEAMVDEIWRPIMFYPGAFVSNQGRVRDWKGFRKPRISSSHVYPHVEIPYGGSKMVHEIVSETWLGLRPKGMYICHNNDNKLDARVANLRYDTPAANIRDKVRNQRKSERL